MFITTLPPSAEKLLTKFERVKWLKDFYLAGGTALALQYGHRQSVDLDFFTQKKINTSQLIKKLSKIGKLTLTKEEENTVEGILNDVKVSFMTYPYPMLEKEKKYSDNIKLASPNDIAVMKLEAVAGRNTKKDFIDLYFYLQNEKANLQNLIKKLQLKFKGLTYDFYHLYKSLIYFVDADKDVMPLMLKKTDWPKIKKYFVNEIKKLA